jgi:hypothetical protein
MLEKESPEKRKFPRLEGVSFPVEYLLKEKVGAFRPAKATSIGESGFMILLEEALSLGTLLQLKLYLPKTLFPFSSWRALNIEAKVVRIEDQVDSNGLHRHGILITQISGQDAASLKNYVHLVR